MSREIRRIMKSGLPQFRSFIVSHLEGYRRFYPGILEWFYKVETELKDESRWIFLVLDDGAPAGFAMTKNGESIKLCHLSICSYARRRGHGKALMEHVFNNAIQRGVSSIYTTTSERSELGTALFLSLMGFNVVGRKANLYQNGVDEFIWVCDGFKGVDRMSKKIKQVILRCGEPTQNGRVYPADVMAEAIEKFNNRTCGSSVSVCKEGKTKLEDVAGYAQLSMDGKEMVAEIELMDTPVGKELQKKLGDVRFSPFGVGNVEDGVVTDYELRHVSVSEKEQSDE